MDENTKRSLRSEDLKRSLRSENLKRSLRSDDLKFKIEDIKVGEGAEVTGGDYITIHYHGTLKDGTVFDSSYERGAPFKTRIGVGEVIEGWDMGVPGMKKGGKRKLTIPSKLAYGDQEVGSIPAGSTLIFEVELVNID